MGWKRSEWCRGKVVGGKTVVIGGGETSIMGYFVYVVLGWSWHGYMDVENKEREYRAIEGDEAVATIGKVGKEKTRAKKVQEFVLG